MNDDAQTTTAPRAIQITHIHYKRLISDGNYGNTEVGADATILDGNDPAAALAELAAFVDEHHRVNTERIRARADDEHANNELVWKRQDLERKLADAQKRWDAAKVILDKAGVNVKELYGDDIPF